MTTQTIQNTETTHPAVPKVKRHGPVVVPRSDIYETAEALVVLTELPGVREANVRITLEKDVLVIEGAPENEAPEGYRLAYAEYQPGHYRRVFNVTAEINRDSIDASLKDGVLKLVLPKVEPAKARTIVVRTGV